MDQLGAVDCKHLFSYFAEHIPSNADRSRLDFLRRLPIFPALLSGRHIALTAGPHPAASCPPAQIRAAVGDILGLPAQIQVRRQSACQPSREQHKQAAAFSAQDSMHILI